MLLMVVKEHEIMRDEKEGEDKIDSYGAILIGITLIVLRGSDLLIHLVEKHH
jgi:hypothetical protein